MSRKEKKKDLKKEQKKELRKEKKKAKKDKKMNKEKSLKLYQKCLITLLVLVGYRVLCTIPTPGVNTTFFNLLINSNASLGILNAFAGANLSTLSIMALNITPYISASIVIQLLETSSEKLKRLSRGTKKDKRVIEYITYVLTGIFALSESLGMAVTFGKQGLLVEYTALWVACIVAIWTVTALIVAVFAKKMDDNKNVFVGKGMSLFLVTNILSSLPSNLQELYTSFIEGKEYAVLLGIAGVSILFILLTFIAFLQETEKRIEVSYSSNVIYERTGTSPRKQIIPIKLMPASVMPVIFAMALMSLPVLIASFTGKTDIEWIKYFDTSTWFNLEDMKYTIGCILYVVLVFAFSYFYVDISLNPYEMAEDLQKSGGFIKDIKTNTETGKYLKRNIYWMATFGAIVLSVVTVLPYVLSGIYGLSKMSFLGTSVLIIVAAIIETSKDISASRIVEKHNSKDGGLFNEIKG